jgi:hypothetical protein
MGLLYLYFFKTFTSDHARVSADVLSKGQGTGKNVKINFTLEKVTKAHSGSRDIAIPFL